jgi:hypothetical protein
MLLRQIRNAVDTWKTAPINTQESWPLLCTATQVEIDTYEGIGSGVQVKRLPPGWRLLQGDTTCGCGFTTKASRSVKTNVLASSYGKFFEKPDNHTKVPFSLRMILEYSDLASMLTSVVDLDYSVSWSHLRIISLVRTCPRRHSSRSVRDKRVD